MADAYVESLMELDEDSILTQLNSIAQELGLIKEVFETSRIYLHYAVFARVFGHISQIIGQYYDTVDLDNTTDEALLEQQIKPFVTKRDARVAKTILRFSRRDDYFGTNNDILIPRDLEVSTEGDDPIIFRTAEARTLWKDTYAVLIPAYSVEVGSVNNVDVNTLTFFDDNEYFPQIKVTNIYPAYGGSDEETAFDARERIGMFRYGRDSTRLSILDLLYDNGVSYYACNLVEYYEGYGTVLISMDVDSEEEFNDIVAAIEAQKPGGVKYQYSMVDYVYININITIKIVVEKAYTPYEKDEIENSIKTAIETYFANQVYVGKKLSVNRLESYILQFLFDEQYDIYEVDIDIEDNSDLNVDFETGQLKVEPFQRLSPNLIYTTIEYNIDA
jgi:hypothetical protein